MTRLTRHTFQGIVNEELCFLVIEYHFREGVPQGPNGVRFEGEALRLDVAREHNSDVVSFAVFRKDTRAVYGLQEMLLALSPKAASEARCSAEDALTLRRGLKRVAKVCRKELRDVFEVDKVVLDTIDVHVSARRRELTLAARFGNRLLDANTAWEKKDWGSALVLYGAAEVALAPYQKRRLEYLRKRLPST